MINNNAKYLKHSFPVAVVHHSLFFFYKLTYTIIYWLTWRLLRSLAFCMSVCLFVNNFLVTILLLFILHHQTLPQCKLYKLCHDRNNFFFFGYSDRLKVMWDIGKSSKFQNCSRAKLLWYTVSVSWPKLLCSRSNTCYRLSIRNTGKIPNPTCITQI